MIAIPARPLTLALLAALILLQIVWHGVIAAAPLWQVAIWVAPLLTMALLVRRPDSVAAIVAALVMLVYLIFGIAESMGSDERWPGMVQGSLAAAYVLAIAISSKRS